MKSLIKKLCNKEVITYTIFGVLTTVVSFVTLFILVHFFHLEENLSNAISIIAAVIFAYFTNKHFVFHTKTVGLKENLSEFSKFALGRAFSMIVELVGFYILCNLANIEYTISKILISIIIIILNYFISKFFAFKK